MALREIKEGLPSPENEGQVRALLRVRDLNSRVDVYKTALKNVHGIPSRLTAGKILEEIEKRQLLKPAPPKRLSPTQKITKALKLTNQIETAIAEGKSIKRLLAQLRKALGE